MKVVLLLAGMGRRMGAWSEHHPKALILLSGWPLLGHLLERFLFFGLKDIVLIVGYQKEQIVTYIEKHFKEKMSLTIVDNPNYAQTNNMYSLWCAKRELVGQEFILCNGDLIFNRWIIKDIPDKKGLSLIVVDDAHRSELIDSPRVLVRQGRVENLSRSIPVELSFGYAIGVYKFSQDLSEAYFEKAGHMVRDGRFNAGFHDPLVDLFSEYPVLPLGSQGLSWADVDCPDDIPRAEAVLKHIIREEKQRPSPS